MHEFRFRQPSRSAQADFRHRIVVGLIITVMILAAGCLAR